MKLIVIVQKIDINDDNLSFFHRMLEKFGERLKVVYAVCLSEGEHCLPDNIKVFSLGKERGYSKIRQLFRLQKFLFAHLRQVNGVYVHMGSVFAIASFPLAKLFNKKLVLWYAHGALPWKLKITEKLVDGIVTSSVDGCRLKSKKIKALGQGIDTEFFQPSSEARPPRVTGLQRFRLLYAARFVPVKGHATLIEAINILVNQRNINDIKLRIMGTPLVESEKEYLAGLKEQVAKYKLDNYVEFFAGAPHAKMPEYYREADLFVNPSSTGSLDKVVLEAMASGCLVLTCNEAYKKILQNKYLFERDNALDLADKIASVMTALSDPALREIVVRHHNLNNQVDDIISQFK